MTLRTLEKSPSNKEFTKKSGEMQGPTVGNLCTDAPSPKKNRESSSPQFFWKGGSGCTQINSRCPFKQGVRLIEVSVRRELTVHEYDYHKYYCE